MDTGYFITLLDLESHESELVDSVEKEGDGALGDLRGTVQLLQQNTLTRVQVVPATENRLWG